MPVVEISGIAVATCVAGVLLFGLALRGRSWPLWLAGYGTMLLTLLLAWRAR